MKHKFVSKILRIAYSVLDVIAPRLCANCGKEAYNFALLCDHCAKSIIIATSPQQIGKHLLFSATDYRDSAAQNLIKTMKYDCVISAGAPLAKIILQHLDIAGFKQIIPSDKNIFLVPVPIHFIKQLRRGFNQSEILANIIGNNLGITVIKALRRRIYTTAQSNIADNKVRSLNIKNCFALARGAIKIPPKSVIIILDDVVTSGATIKEAARIIKPLHPSQVIFISASAC